KLEILETLDVERRLEVVIAWARDVLAAQTLKDRIRKDVAEGMEKSQRQFLLRQQMEAIRKELAEDEEGDDDLDRFRALVENEAVAGCVRKAVERQLNRLQRTPQQSTEYGWIHTWLETMAEIPWGVTAEDSVDLDAARAILDADHTGLDDVKTRIMEHLAVRKRRTERGLSVI